MKTSLTLNFCLVAILSFGQSGWLRDLKLAQTVAKNKNQLILVDFWAIWCGPCKQMDADVWNTPQAETFKQNFVPVKIDIDQERSLAATYGVKSIPMLILMDYTGKVLYTSVGYSGKDQLVNFISQIPKDAKELYSKSSAIDPKSETFSGVRDLGIALQLLSEQTNYEPLSRSLLTQSDQYFKKSLKLTKQESEIHEVQLLSSLNWVYRNNPKKAIKEITENTSQYIGTENESLMYYALLLAYKKNGDQNNYDSYLSKLKNRDDAEKFISKL